MQTVASPAAPIPAGGMDGDDLLAVLGIYLQRIAGTKTESIMDTPIGADDVIIELVKDELAEIAKLDGEVPSAVMYVTNFAVTASVVAINEPPREAVQLIADLVAKLRKRLRDIIKLSRRDKSPEAA